MRHNQNAKRSRGRGRRSGNSGQNSFNRNTTFESNGPEGRLRGNAQQLFEKYTSLANDAQSAGERVLFEANSQFADHYYRIHQSILANAEQRRQNDDRTNGRKQHPKSDVEAGDAPDVSSDASASDVSANDTPTSDAPVSDNAISGEAGDEAAAASAPSDDDAITDASDDNAAVA